MTNQEIIMQLSIVIAQQRKEIESLESTKDFLRHIKEANELQISNLTNEMELLKSQPKEA